MGRKHGLPATEASLTGEGWLLQLATMKREIVLETSMPEDQTPGGKTKRRVRSLACQKSPFPLCCIC